MRFSRLVYSVGTGKDLMDVGSCGLPLKIYTHCSTKGRGELRPANPSLPYISAWCSLMGVNRPQCPTEISLKF